MKSLNKQDFRPTVSKMETTELREEANCSNPDCKERFHMSELVNLNAEYKGLKYDSLVCIPCQYEIHTLIEVETILKNASE